MRERLYLPHRAAGAAWFYDSRNVALIRTHRHSELEVNLAVSGSARYLFSDTRIDLRPNTQVWMFPAQEHVLVDRSPDFQMWIAVFRQSLVRDLCTTPTTATLRKTNPGAIFCRQIRAADARAMAELCRRIVDATDTDRATVNAGLGWLLVSAWHAYEAAAQPAVGKPVHPAVERAARLVQDDDNADAMKIDELASRCGLSPSRLSRLFKRQAGVSLVHFRQQKRLERFFELYRIDGDGNVLSAAMRAGFGSYPQFHRVFRQSMGVSPRTYYRNVT
jgi:AraC-like DNA-binding protein